MIESVFAQTAGDPLIDWLSRAGSIGILAAAVIAFVRGWIVPGFMLNQVRQERDRALNLLHRQLGLAERTVDLTADRLALEAAIHDLREKEHREHGVP